MLKTKADFLFSLMMGLLSIYRSKSFIMSITQVCQDKHLNSLFEHFHGFFCAFFVFGIFVKIDTLL